MGSNPIWTMCSIPVSFYGVECDNAPQLPFVLCRFAPYCPVRSCGIFWAAKPRPATVISLTKRTFPAIPGPVRIQMDGWEISEPAAQCATRAQYSAQSIYCYLVK